jgi:hypothetical protein
MRENATRLQIIEFARFIPTRPIDAMQYVPERKQWGNNQTTTRNKTPGNSAVPVPQSDNLLLLADRC